MKLRLTLAILLISAGLAMPVGIIHVQWKLPALPYPRPQAGAEQYGTGVNVAGNTTLYWRLFKHTDTPRPMVLVMHVGEFKFGNPGPMGICRDMYYAGYNCAAVQYRLADPGYEMRGPHGNQPLDDHGNYPEQVDDFSAAIIAARTGSTPATAGFVTGQVIGIGGSAGASHVAYMAAATLHGGDKLDCGVMLSGPYDFHDPSINTPNCGNDLGDIFRNYVNCIEGTPECEGDGGALDMASPYRRFGPTSAPVLFFSTQVDPIHINQYNMLVSTLTSVGATFDSRLLTEAVYNPSNGCTRHAFQYWYPEGSTWTDSVSDEVIAFVQSVVPPPPPP